MSCEAKVEWRIHNSGVYPILHSCGKHLSKMVSGDTIVVIPWEGDVVSVCDYEEECCGSTCGPSCCE